MYKAQLQWLPVVLLLILSLTWGANMAIVKIGTREIAPLFMAGFRSLVAAVCLYIWMKIKGTRLFPSRVILFHGIIIGLMFGSEFGLIYMGLQYTTASRVYIFVYTAPFFVALGAHFFLTDDRLNIWKSFGLVVAFCGVVVLFMGNSGKSSMSAIAGDSMALFAGLLWGATTLYVKKFLTGKTIPLQTLFYQVCFSAPVLIFLSLAIEDPIVLGFSPVTAFSVFYQCIIVAFISFLVWFELIHRYPVSLLHAFSFFTPVFGVILSGFLILGEMISPRLVIALLMVSLGIVLVNHRPSERVQ